MLQPIVLIVKYIAGDFHPNKINMDLVYIENQVHWFNIIIPHLVNDTDNDARMLNLKLLPDACYFHKLPAFAKFNDSGCNVHAKHLAANLESTFAFVS